MDALLTRIEAGTTGVDDARLVGRLLDRLIRYELALRRIAIYSAGAMIATQALVEQGARPRGAQHEDCTD